MTHRIFCGFDGSTRLTYPLLSSKKAKQKKIKDDEVSNFLYLYQELHIGLAIEHPLQQQHFKKLIMLWGLLFL